MRSASPPCCSWENRGEVIVTGRWGRARPVARNRWPGRSATVCGVHQHLEGRAGAAPGAVRKLAKTQEFPGSRSLGRRFPWEISQRLFSYSSFRSKASPAAYKKHRPASPDLALVRRPGCKKPRECRRTGQLSVLLRRKCPLNHNKSDWGHFLSVLHRHTSGEDLRKAGAWGGVIKSDTL